MTFETVESLLRQRRDDWWGQLCETIPELKALTGTRQPPEYHAEGDVAVHTRLAIESCTTGCDPDLPWIALLHDIGKPSTTKLEDNGRVTAHGHAKLGAEMAERILLRLAMSPKRCERIVWAIRHHTFHHSWQLKDQDGLTRRQLKYLEDPKFPLLLEFLRIDAEASQGNPDGVRSYRFYKELWEKHSSEPPA